MEAELDALVPDEVKPVEERITLNRKVECWRCRGKGEELEDCATFWDKKVTLKWLKADTLTTIKYKLSGRECKNCKGAKYVNKQYKPTEAGETYQGFTATAGLRWQKILPFMASGSSPCTKKYIIFKGHPLPKVKGKVVTDENGLLKLSKRFKADKVYPLILKIRKNNKFNSTYIEGKYTPDADGRLRTEYGQNSSPGRLTSRNPNLQNVPNHAAAAKEYRKMFIAPQGYRLVELDYKGIEALLVGYYAQDDAYMQYARSGVHAELARHILAFKGMENGGSIKQKHPRIYAQAKRVVHMSNYLGTPFKMRAEYPDDFKTIKAAQELQDLYFNTIGKKIKDWQQSVLREAESKMMLQTPFGWRRYFWDALKYNGEYGQDAKEAVAFLPQSTACDIILRAIERIARKAIYRQMLRLQIHDSLVFEMPYDRNFNKRVAFIKAEMERPIPELGGLSVGVEAAYGKNWGELEDWG